MQDVVIISTRDHEKQHNDEVRRAVNDANSKGWKVIIAVTTTTVLVPRNSLVYERLEYTTTLTLST